MKSTKNRLLSFILSLSLCVSVFAMSGTTFAIETANNGVSTVITDYVDVDTYNYYA